MKFKQITESTINVLETLSKQLGFDVTTDAIPIMQYFIKKSTVDENVPYSLIIDAWSRRAGKSRAEFFDDDIEPILCFIKSYGAKEYFERDEDFVRKFNKY